jgi:hypothetical protein
MTYGSTYQYKAASHQTIKLQNTIDKHIPKSQCHGIKTQVKFLFVHAIETWGRGGKAPFILKLGTSSQIHAPVPNEYTARWGANATVCKFWRNIKKNHLSLPGIEARFLGCPNSNAVVVPSLPSLLLLCLEDTETSTPTKVPIALHLQKVICGINS